MSVESTLARLILSTKRKKRPFDLIQVCNDFQFLLDNNHTVSQISKILGISTGMINKFLRVQKLTPELQELVKSRTIDSVALVHNLVKFTSTDQIKLATALEQNKISTHDVRVLAPLRKVNPDSDLDQLIERLINSKNRKVSVIRIPKEAMLSDVELFKKTIKGIVTLENFEDLIVNNDYYDLKVSKKGELLLRNEAKSAKLSLAELINELVK